MALPLLISVPHGGLRVPDAIAHLNLLTPEEIRLDGDEGAAQIYALQDAVAGFVTTDIARAFVDANRAPDDRRADGVVKTETIYQRPIYSQPLSEPQVSTLLECFYRPYHHDLTEQARHAVLGIDCHTMAAFAPPISPDAGRERPRLCLSHAGHTCPDHWFRTLASCLADSFGCEVAINDPFQGGFIIRHHAKERPWVQLEISRVPFASYGEQRDMVLSALRAWCRLIIPDSLGD